MEKLYQIPLSTNLFLFVLGTLSFKLAIIFDCEFIRKFFKISGGDLILEREPSVVDLDYLELHRTEEYEVHVAFMFINEHQELLEGELKKDYSCEKIDDLYKKISDLYRQYLREQRKQKFESKRLFFPLRSEIKNRMPFSAESLTVGSLSCVQTKDGLVSASNFFFFLTNLCLIIRNKKKNR